MTSVAQVRKAALALPEVEEDSVAGVLTYSVSGTEFARTTRRPATLELHLSGDDPVRDDVPAVELVAETGTTLHVRLGLDQVNGMQSNALVRRAWLAQAPERLRVTMGGAAAAEAGEVGDLPPGIGRPATRALAQEGLTTLDAVAARTPDEVAALHGVGPKAVRILREALAERGTPWA